MAPYSLCFVPQASSLYFPPTPERATGLSASITPEDYDLVQKQQQQPQSHHRRELFHKAFVLGGLLLGSTAVPTPLVQPGDGRLNFVPAAAGAAVLVDTPLPAVEVQAMSTGRAADFIKLNCQGILKAYKETGPIPSFLYRGENVNRPSVMKCLPDLMDPTTYVEGEEAVEFFGKVETAMKNLPVKYVVWCVGGVGALVYVYNNVYVREREREITEKGVKGHAMHHWSHSHLSHFLHLVDSSFTLLT
jgi:hypothetical protein